MNKKSILSNKAFLSDTILNTIAVAFPVAILQLFIYPNIAKIVGTEEYGLMLTIYSIWMIFALNTSEAICSAKIINNEKYIKKNIQGDFLYIAKNWLIVCTLISLIIICFYRNSASLLRIVLETFITSLIFIVTYFECSFRISLEYKKIVLNKIVLSIGYFVGYFLFLYTKLWEFIFIVGYGFSLVFCLANIFKNKEPLVKTELYKTTLRDCYILVVPSLINGLISYADKLVLYPLIGGEEVTIYYVSTLIGKIVGLAASSLKNVLLTYVSKNEKNDRKLFIKALTIGFVLVFVSYFIIILLSKPIINILYSQVSAQVMKYLPITTITAMLDVLVCIIYPYVLKYCDTKWQILFSSISAFIYFGISILLLNRFGLIGFCIGTVIGQVLKLLMMIIVYFKKSPIEN